MKKLSRWTKIFMSLPATAKQSLAMTNIQLILPKYLQHLRKPPANLGAFIPSFIRRVREDQPLTEQYGGWGDLKCLEHYIFRSRCVSPNLFIRRFQIIIFTFSLLITLIIANITSYALTVNEVPNPRQQYGGWVTDMVDMLSPQAENQLNQMISQLENQNGTEIAIVTVPTTKPSPTPKEFTNKLFNSWGIGKPGKNNGILFLVSKGDRRTEIETGRGITKILPNAKISGIIKEQVTPKFKQGKFEAGILAGTKSLIKELRTDVEQPTTNVNNQARDSEVNEQPFIQNHYIHFLWILLVLPLWKFIVLPLTKSIFNFFGNIRKFFGNLNKDYLSPSGVTRRSFPFINRKACCEQCSKPMEEVAPKEINSVLTKPQKVAQEIGSTKYKGWRCADCAKDSMHLLILQSYKASTCPTCEELTVTKVRTETIKQATKYSSGTRRIWKQCQCCDYATTTDEMIPQLLSTHKSTRRKPAGFKHHRSYHSIHHSHSFSHDCDDYSSYESEDINDYSSYESEDNSDYSCDESEDISDYSSDESEDTSDYSCDESSSDDSDFGGGESDGDGGGDDW